MFLLNITKCFSGLRKSPLRGNAGTSTPLWFFIVKIQALSQKNPTKPQINLASRILVQPLSYWAVMNWEEGEEINQLWSDKCFYCWILWLSQHCQAHWPEGNGKSLWSALIAEEPWFGTLVAMEAIDFSHAVPGRMLLVASARSRDGTSFRINSSITKQTPVWSEVLDQREEYWRCC